MIETYIKLVQTEGTFLEVIDAEVFCQQAGKNLAIGVDHSGQPMEVQVSTAFWSTLLPGGDVLDEYPVIDRSDPDSFCLISCNAAYNANEPERNHWVPGYFKEQLSKQAWTKLTTNRCKDLSNRHTSTVAHVKKLQAKADELTESSSPMAVAKLQSELHAAENESKRFLCSAEL
jgi:hypothetical protein